MNIFEHGAIYYLRFHARNLKITSRQSRGYEEERAMGAAIDTLLDDYERLRGESEWLRRGLEQARDTLARIADPSDGTRDAGFWSLGGVRAEARVRASISTTYLERKL